MILFQEPLIHRHFMNAKRKALKPKFIFKNIASQVKNSHANLKYTK
jgi:hypothetical protein